MVYGINYQEVRDDPTLLNKRREIIIDAARKLDKVGCIIIFRKFYMTLLIQTIILIQAKMIRFDERTSYLHATDLGRTASQFYIKYDTVEVFNEMLKPVMNEADILAMLAKAQEFEQLKVRDDELDELDNLTRDNCEVPVI